MNDLSSDRLWKRDEIDSPCVKVCVIHPQTGLCVGCQRSLGEIAAWSQMAPEERSRVMAELPGRAGKLRQRRGGRAARLRENEQG